MKWFSLLFVFFLFACNGSGGGRSPNQPVNVEDTTALQEAKAFIQNTQKDIPPSLQITKPDLQDLNQEGLATTEEANELTQIIK